MSYTSNPNLIQAHLNLVAPGVQEITRVKARYDALAVPLKALDNLVYRPNSIRGALKSLIKDNIVLDENEWAVIVAKKKALEDERAGLKVQLVELQKKMDYVLVNLPAE